MNVPGFGISVNRLLTHSFAAKINWKAMQQLNLIFTITGDPAVEKAVGFGFLTAPSNLINPDPYFRDLTQGGFNISLNRNYTLGQNLLFEASFARVNRHDTGVPSTKAGKEIYFEDRQTQTVSGGVDGSWDSFRFTTTAKLKGTFITRQHIVTTGIEYEDSGVDNQYERHLIVKVNDTVYAE